ncbi:hypothetical protein ABZY44_37555 [Streptomyces sp. NPDC006544]|uniref:hypothetical protein n=1 Tax=Streptomyces sp. NPDC006544 TaxID=3154583 RepID=UPI0033A1C8E7
MLFLVAAFLLMGILLGTVAHVPTTVSLVATAAIAVWLMVFALRERAGRHHRADRQEVSS